MEENKSSFRWAGAINIKIGNIYPVMLFVRYVPKEMTITGLAKADIFFHLEGTFHLFFKKEGFNDEVFEEFLNGCKLFNIPHICRRISEDFFGFLYFNNPRISASSSSS